MALPQFQTGTVVIGAGVVGLACARELALRGQEVLVLEATHTFGTGVSSRNSEVIHAGLYYPTASLRQRVCVDGRRRLYGYLESHSVAHRKCGKLVVATSPDEEAYLQQLLDRATANGVETVRLLARNEIGEMEPALTVRSALFSGETGIVDARGLMLALLGDLEGQGGSLAPNAPVEHIAPMAGGGFEVATGGSDPALIQCRRLVNAAGLNAQSVSRSISGLAAEATPPLVLAKGSYFSCTAPTPFSHLIYPAPVNGGLGVHVTLDLGGQMRFGPDVEWLDHNDPSRVDYRVDVTRADGFYEAIRRYWPGLPDGSIQPAYAGCRPKLSGPDQPAADFLIQRPETHGVPGLVQLFGIESPGLTSCLSLAVQVAEALAD
jgi:L-2-hydroxyglutarate oxidase LhgO